MDNYNFDVGDAMVAYLKEQFLGMAKQMAGMAPEEMILSAFNIAAAEFLAGAFDPAVRDEVAPRIVALFGKVFTEYGGVAS